MWSVPRRLHREWRRCRPSLRGSGPRATGLARPPGGLDGPPRMAGVRSARRWLMSGYPTRARSGRAGHGSPAREVWRRTGRARCLPSGRVLGYASMRLAFKISSIPRDPRGGRRAALAHHRVGKLHRGPRHHHAPPGAPNRISARVGAAGESARGAPPCSATAGTRASRRRWPARIRTASPRSAASAPGDPGAHAAERTSRRTGRRRRGRGCARRRARRAAINRPEASSCRAFRRRRLT